MRYLVTIKRVDFTEDPPTRYEAEKFIIDLEPSEMEAVLERATKLFALDAEHNDECYTFAIVPDVDEWEPQDLKDWLDGFAEHRQVDESQPIPETL